MKQNKRWFLKSSDTLVGKGRAVTAGKSPLPGNQTRWSRVLPASTLVSQEVFEFISTPLHSNPGSRLEPGTSKLLKENGWPVLQPG